MNETTEKKKYVFDIKPCIFKFIKEHLSVETQLEFVNGVSGETRAVTSVYLVNPTTGEKELISRG